jgi:hypothetical protein
MAYNHPGTCLWESGRPREAAPVLREGKEAATIEGDPLPGRDTTRKPGQIIEYSS